MNTASVKPVPPKKGKPRPRFWRLALLVMLFLLLGVTIALVIWLRPYAASADAMAALHTTPGVTVTQNDEMISFLPSTRARVGLIFYPGAKVDPAAYAITMHALAEDGYATFILKMPLNIALLAENRADDVIAAHPEIAVWAVGGHSLGGVAASDYAANHGKIRGLLLFASYPNGDLSHRSHLQVLSVSGSHDGLATPDKIAAAKHLLPVTTRYIVIQGGIHSYFGDYGVQDGDGQPTITRSQARTQIIAASLAFLNQLTAHTEKSTSGEWTRDPGENVYVCSGEASSSLAL
ncbi:alpha/beta hydrolase [Thermosporothrix hazakensis]|nr:alpha/beta hydrolase [Thermosporothrix hazakensis]BBH87527.1 thioesterase [Thermosporothrix sp. COM3]GCE49968.1 thioesterase [Thermosporothrix hazakensis]